MTENEIKNTKEWFENFIETYALSNQETIEFQKAVACLEELQQYRAIGTADELKALKEKSEPKKIAHQGCYDAEGVLHIWNGVNGVPYDLCPNCETNLCTDGPLGNDKKTMKYCKNCGQRLNWNNTDI